MKRRSRLLLLAWIFGSPAFAQGAGDKAAAEALFAEGRALLASGNFAPACSKFAASLRLDAAVGTMLNLADCYEKTGRTASAWAEFREASAAARDAGSRPREQVAKDRAAALEPKLSRLTVNLPASNRGATVTRDGSTLDDASLGSAVPVDPGAHTLTASAPGKRKWTKEINVPAGGGTVAVNVPALENEAVAAAVPVVSFAAHNPPTSEEPARVASPQKTIAVVAAGVGVVGLAVGTYAGLTAQSAWHDADDACPSHKGCSSTSIDSRDKASSLATVSTVGFIVGGAALATGAMLWLTAPAPRASLALGVSPGSVALRGSF